MKDMNCFSTAFGVRKKQVHPWWLWHNKLMPFAAPEANVLWEFDDLCMDAPDLIPSGCMFSPCDFLGMRNVGVVDRGNWVSDDMLRKIEAARLLEKSLIEGANY